MIFRWWFIADIGHTTTNRSRFYARLPYKVITIVPYEISAFFIQSKEGKFYYPKMLLHTMVSAAALRSVWSMPREIDCSRHSEVYIRIIWLLFTFFHHKREHTSSTFKGFCLLSNSTYLCKVFPVAPFRKFIFVEWSSLLVSFIVRLNFQLSTHRVWA